MKKEKRDLRNLSLVLQVGLTMLIPIALFLLFGLWIFHKTGDSTWLILCILFGMFSGISSTWRLLKARIGKDEENKEEVNLMAEWTKEEEKEPISDEK